MSMLIYPPEINKDDAASFALSKSDATEAALEAFPDWYSKKCIGNGMTKSKKCSPS